MRLGTSLPVEKCIDPLLEALRTHDSAVLCAAPGAGKSTVVPPSLLDEKWLCNRKIIMLEPRRIAARATARRIAYLMGENIGQTVGYRTRLDSVIGKNTRIEVITEGILTRMIQDDPALEDVALVIFDEFHERSIHADLGLALCLDSRSAFREDLKILVMSATLDSEKVSNLLGSAPVISSEGRLFNVETVYFGSGKADSRLENEMTRAIIHGLNSHSGDVLAFLPGEYEIKACRNALTNVFPGQNPEAANIMICPLYGNLPHQEQDRALEPVKPPLRKVILATSIAETSLTVDGVRIVVDSGLARVPKFCPRTAMNRLETVSVSRASAEQRRGRAGRTAEGVCIRLWSVAEERAFEPYNKPEILESDLAPFALELAKWGADEKSVRSMKWLDLPPEAKLTQAYSLLRDLGAVSESGSKLTKHGERLLKMPLHPRLAHMVAEAADKLRSGALACDIAAIVSERDFMKRAASSDIRDRLAYLKSGDTSDDASEGAIVDRNSLRMIRTAADQIRRSVGIRDNGTSDSNAAGIILSFAYPDRIARARTPKSGEYNLSNGASARMRKGDPMSANDLVSAAITEGDSSASTIYLSAPLSLEEIGKYMPHIIRDEVVLGWDSERKAVFAEQARRIGSIALDRRPLALSSRHLSRERITQALMDGIRKEGLSVLKFPASEKSTMARVMFLRGILGEEWPDMSEPALLASLEKWLAPFISNETSAAAISPQTLSAALDSLMTRQQRISLDTLAPERIEVPSGSKIRVDYEPNAKPKLSVLLQELFGMTESPRIANGRASVVMDILSPSMRTVQITEDLAGFWQNSYFLVRKDMRGRYPKHDWPENPLDASPHRGVKKRRPENT